MLYSFRAFRLFRDLYLIPKRIMRKFKENYAVKLLELCRQTPRIMPSNYSQYRNKK